MKVRLQRIVIALLMPALLAACQNGAENSDRAQNVPNISLNASGNSADTSNHSATLSSPSPKAAVSSASTPSQATSLNQDLTNAKVEAAVNALLRDFRIAGTVRVRGVRELPQENSALADLRFEEFTYAVTTEGRIIKAKDFKIKPQPKDYSRLPTMEEMFPPRKVVYAKDGKAVLSRYNDGRWVLKEVRWGFDTGVKGTIEIR